MKISAEDFGFEKISKTAYATVDCGKILYLDGNDIKFTIVNMQLLYRYALNLNISPTNVYEEIEVCLIKTIIIDNHFIGFEFAITTESLKKYPNLNGWKIKLYHEQDSKNEYRCRS